MFERYTERARRVIFFSRYEASQFGAPAIEPEHLLLGLMREDAFLTEQFLPEIHNPLGVIRKEVEARTPPREKISTSIDLPLASSAKRVLGYAQEESERLGQRYIGTHHLLLGLLREEKALAAEILRGHGLAIEQVREEVSRLESSVPTSGGRTGDDTGDGTARRAVGRASSASLKDLAEITLYYAAFGHWTDAARQAFFLARCETGGVGARSVAPEHLLLGLLRVDEAPAIASLARLRERYAEIQNEVEASASEKPFPLLVRIPVAAATLRAVAHAQETQERLGRERLEVEHLLLGLLAEGGARVVALAAAQGALLEVVRAEIDALENDDDA